MRSARRVLTLATMYIAVRLYRKTAREMQADTDSTVSQQSISQRHAHSRTEKPYPTARITIPLKPKGPVPSSHFHVKSNQHSNTHHQGRGLFTTTVKAIAAQLRTQRESGSVWNCPWSVVSGPLRGTRWYLSFLRGRQDRCQWARCALADRLMAFSQSGHVRVQETLRWWAVIGCVVGS